MPLLLIFFDGIGIGDKKPSYNPFARLPSKYFIAFRDNYLPIAPKGGIIVPTYAGLEVEGLPQSATGQATLLTGKNAAKLIGRHLEGLPNSTLKNLIKKENIFSKLMDKGCKATFANAYRPSFFNNYKRRISATTTAALSAKLQLRTLQDLAKGEAVYQDYTNHFLIRQGYKIKKISASEAAERLVKLLQDHDFVLYEYFLSDIAGHKMKMDEALAEVRKMDALIKALLEIMDLENNLLVVTSDHGNLEDLRIKMHTNNPVPTIVWGLRAQNFSREIISLLDIAPAIIKYLKEY